MSAYRNIDRRFDQEDLGRDLGPTVEDNIRSVDERYNNDILTSQEAEKFNSNSDLLVEEVNSLPTESIIEDLSPLTTPGQDFRVEPRDPYGADYRAVDGDSVGDRDEIVESPGGHAPTIASPDIATQNVAAYQKALDDPDVISTARYGESEVSALESLRVGKEISDAEKAVAEDLKDKQPTEDILPPEDSRKSLSEVFEEMNNELTNELSGEQFSNDSVAMSVDSNSRESNDKDLQEEELLNSLKRKEREKKEKDKDAKVEVNPASNRNIYVPERELKNKDLKKQQEIDKDKSPADIEIVSRHNDDFNAEFSGRQQSERKEDELRKKQEQKNLEEERLIQVTLETQVKEWNDYYNNLINSNKAEMGVQL